MASEELNKLYAKKFKLWKQLLDYGDFMRGSMVTLKRPCTYKGCTRCQKGIKHPTTYHSISRKSKTTLIYLPKHIQPTVKRLIDNYRKVASLMDQISEVTIKVVRLRIKERSRR